MDNIKNDNYLCPLNINDIIIRKPELLEVLGESDDDSLPPLESYTPRMCSPELQYLNIKPDNNLDDINRGDINGDINSYMYMNLNLPATLTRMTNTISNMIDKVEKVLSDVQSNMDDVDMNMSNIKPSLPRKNVDKQIIHNYGTLNFNKYISSTAEELDTPIIDVSKRNKMNTNSIIPEYIPDNYSETNDELDDMVNELIVKIKELRRKPDSHFMMSELLEYIDHYL